MGIASTDSPVTKRRATAISQLRRPALCWDLFSLVGSLSDARGLTFPLPIAIASSCLSQDVHIIP